MTVSFDYQLSDVLAWNPDRRRRFFKISYQVDDEVYNGYHSDTEIRCWPFLTRSEEQKLDWHFNHSCDPNCWYLDKDVVETRRAVVAGEELCYDYASRTSADFS